MKIEKLEHLVDTAREWAKLHHAGQKYAYGSDYFETHILEVEKTVIELMHSPHYTRTDRYLARAVALLHDIVEDTDVSITEIQRTFGHRIAQCVLDLTKLSGEDWESQWSRAKRNYLSLVVKKADILVNLKVSVATNKLNLVDKYTTGLRYLSL
ncbi:hypothetical protein VPT02_059 [Vibrio phage VPT02]|uniref:Uncharacterized protein n=1 Tax=Vibrio phage pVp-1 TaxID=1150989 RepID=H6WXH5_9CAUD|nr:metal-dependent phosphohydrolase [Vibrio phage pVp-1]AFB83941.1 hypothetical protein pVp-1_0084 [Vibrio phage pVp-1]QIG60635.1 hypothetical protein VPT02_059 [Vibrio phage VPT02]QQO38416.1 hypothetical protein VPG01_058 [Vibrio phage VPG01]